MSPRRHVLLRDRVLRELVQQPVPRQPATIAKLTGLSPMRAKRALGELERLGYVEAPDRQGCYLATERGRAAAAEQASS